jgi:hypothetical protein
MAEKNAIQIAQKETHCGMCRIDYLGTGLCPSGKKHGFIAYWPQGRMEIYKALHTGALQPTKKLIEITDSCTLCGICDKQCSFITNRRPSKVHEALKEYVRKLDKSTIQTTPSDDVLRELQHVVGEQWATNDPIILTAYLKTILNQAENHRTYVVMPKTSKEVADIIKIAHKFNLPFLPRGNGTFLSVALQTLLAGPVGLKQGVILDLSRMNAITIDPEKRTATIEAGVSAWALQKEAKKHRLRALVGEAEAYICVNILSFGIISTWGNTYGWGADNYVDVELVDAQGTISHRNSTTIEALYPKRERLNLTLKPSHIVTRMIVPLHPTFDDEQALFVPFERLDDAVDFAHDLAKRNIGTSLAILSSKYFSDFICPTNEIAHNFERIAREYLHLNYLVDIICRRSDRQYIEDHAEVTLEEDMMKKFVLSTPKLASMGDNEFLKALAKEENPIKSLFGGPLKHLLIKALDPSPEQIADAFDTDLKDFFTKLYAKPEMIDSIWLHEFRILPSRMLRQHMFMVRGGFMTAKKEVILQTHDALKEVGDEYHTEHALGFIGFLDSGKIAFLEYDYYYDHTDPEVYPNLNQSIVESLQRELTIDGLLPLEFSFHKGLQQKEHMFYPFPKGLTPEELQQFGQMVQQIVTG